MPEADLIKDNTQEKAYQETTQMLHKNTHCLTFNVGKLPFI